MKDEQKINPENIRIAGKKLKSIPAILVIQIFVLLVLVFVVASISSGFSKISNQGLERLFGIIVFVNIFFAIIVLVKIYGSGENLILSVIDKEESSTFKDEEIPKFENLKIEEKYYSNGKIKSLESFNDKGEKHGVWIYYLKNGEVDGKELYENGFWIRNIN
jgi:hypothetical protein